MSSYADTVLHDAITEVLPPAWVLTDDTVSASADDPPVGRVTAADLHATGTPA